MRLQLVRCFHFEELKVSFALVFKSWSLCRAWIHSSFSICEREIS